MNTMAVASRSSASDARVPCSSCGGLVHPIAGRCKHCKADLAAARTARAPALNPTPAPARSPEVATPAPSAPNAETLVGATPVALPTTLPSIVVVPAAPARPAYNPIPDGVAILPPRPTGRMRVAGDQRGWLARNWPVFVIILASLAIILAVVLMMIGPKDEVDVGTKNNAAGPAPERMETNPLPTPNTDPWQNGQPPRVVPPNTAPVPPADPDDQSMIDPGDPLKDPFASPQPRVGGVGGNIGMALLGNIAHRLCDKAKSCSDQTVASMCSGLSMFPTSPIPASCPQAKRCIEMMDQIDVCDGSLSGGLGGPNFPQLMMRTSDCMDALTSC